MCIYYMDLCIQTPTELRLRSTPMWTLYWRYEAVCVTPCLTITVSSTQSVIVEIYQSVEDKTTLPVLRVERMIGGWLDWTSLRSLILQFVIHHKSSRPNTVNLSGPYHLLWSFIQITMIAFSWPLLAGWSPLTRRRWEMWGREGGSSYRHLIILRSSVCI